MPIKLKNCGRNHKKRKEYIKQSGLLLVGVDVSEDVIEALLIYLLMNTKPVPDINL